MRDFDIVEFDCPCCGENQMDEYFLAVLQVARNKYHALFIELKEKKGKARKGQKEILQLLANEGNYACICKGADAAINIISKYLKGEL